VRKTYLPYSLNFWKSNIELSWRPDRSHAPTVQGTAPIVPYDPEANNSNDLLDFPTYDGGVDSHDALRRITDIISFTKKPCKPTLAESITWPHATAVLVQSATTSEVVTRSHTAIRSTLHVSNPNIYPLQYLTPIRSGVFRSA